MDLLNFDELRLMKKIQDRIEQERLDLEEPENRCLLFCLNGPEQVLYENHAPNRIDLLQEAFDRAPKSQSGPIFDSRPPLEYGVIFDSKTDELVLYHTRAL